MPRLHSFHFLTTPLTIVILVMLQACTGGSSGDDEGSFTQALSASPSPRSCSVAGINTWVYESMQDYYLFYSQVPSSVNTGIYDTPEQLIRDLRVQPFDSFSYVTEETSYTAFFNEGETFGYGWNFSRNSSGALLFALIDPGSPLDFAGVQRGETLVAINGIDTDEFTQQTQEQINDILGTGEQSRTLTLRVADSNQQERQVSVTKATYTLQTVLDTDILQANGTSVGYLHLSKFLATSSEELAQAFSTLASDGVSELVLDLRFNSGGRISVANELASRIAGIGHDGDVFTTFAFNDKYSAYNTSLLFETMADSLELNRVFVLQSEVTCSASELVVNSLRPFMEVITIGQTSCGKPYATSPSYGCGKVANALEIELLNAAGAGGYYDGIAADCPVPEDVSKPLGDQTEPLLSAALDYIATGSCAISPRSRSGNAVELTNTFKPVWHGGNTL